MDYNNILYWKKRCQLAEKYIDEIGVDSHVSPSQLRAFCDWVDYKNLRDKRHPSINKLELK